MKRQLIGAVMAACALAANAQKELKLHYDTPATYFEETLVIGNGNLGAIVYGGVGEEKISLNDITLWTGEPDLKVYNPDGYKAIPDIRKALSQENYRLADQLQRKDQGHYSENYQPLGQLVMTDVGTNGASTNGYQRSLDISEAVARVQYAVGNAAYQREYFASAPDSVIIIKLKADKGGKINRRFGYRCQLMHMTAAKDKEMTIDGYAAWSSKPGYAGGGFQYDSNRGVHFRTIIHVENKDGELALINDNELLLTDCTEATIFISNVTSFNGLDKDPVKEGKDYRTLVRNRIDNAVKQTYDDLMERHRTDYKSLFDRFSINLGTTAADILAKTTERQLRDYTERDERNPELEALYMQYGRYLLISCSRTDMVPANLQGLWNEQILPPWSCNYTSNINLEENYWPSEIANLGELHKPLLDFVEKLPVTGQMTAKAYYGVQDGWCLAHNTDFWGMTCPVGEGGGDPNWANWNMGGAWVSTHIWEHYMFSMDKDYLRRAYPTLKGAADFCMGWMIPLSTIAPDAASNPYINPNLKLGAIDYLVTAPCTSPENTYMTPDGYDGRTIYGGSADLAMIRECLMDARQATIVLGGDKAYIQKIDDTLARILPYQIGKDGSLQEWFYDWKDTDPQHRHQSHLFGLFPGHGITVSETPELAQACKRALEIKGDKTTGWSTGWRVNLQARLREPEAAYHIYRKLLNYISPDKYKGPDKRKGGGTYPNLLDAHSPFQIDGNFGGTAGVIEMLVQSDLKIDKNGRPTATLTLLPALPEAWKAEGSIKGVRCRGGYEVSLSWKNGKVTSYALKSVSGQRMKVTVHLPGKITKNTTVK
ncbi:MAG: glycoside hydrolase family 95 protein [Bacteroidaceae bacterium]|nr:glycoside hydrolase family 95 protein [Bacteroidaceae bacterium]